MLHLPLQYELKVFQTIRNSLGIFSINCEALQVWCCFKFGAAMQNKLEAPHISRIKLCNWKFMSWFVFAIRIEVFQTIPNSLAYFLAIIARRFKFGAGYAKPNFEASHISRFSLRKWNVMLDFFCNTN